MTNLDQIGAAWIVACLAPWAISPHPNFSQSDVNGPSRLALVTERRFERERRREVADGPTLNELEARLIDQAEASLWEGSQRDAVDRLWGLTAEPDLAVGARVAAALYASVGESELEGTAIAAARTAFLFDELRARILEADGPAPGSHLVLAALLQQSLLRQLDCEQFDSIESTITELQRLTRVASGGFADFPLSQGIAWRSKRVQSEILTTMRKNALRAETHRHLPDSQTWMSLVRSPPTWPDVRTSWVAAERDAERVRDDFESMFEATSGKVVLMRSTAQSTGYAALLLTELGGDLGAARRAREAQGKLVLLSANGDVGRTREGLRLLRQSRADSPLKSALAWVRDTGPTTALKQDARSVISRAARDGWMADTDLSCLAAAADFIGMQSQATAIRVALDSMENRQLAGRGGWSLHDQTWRAVASLVGGSGADDLVVRRLGFYLDHPDHLSEPLTRTLSRVASEVTWKDINDDLRERWIDWVATTDENDENRALAITIRRAMGDSVLAPIGVSLERAAYLIDTDDADPAEVAQVGEYLASTLEEEGEQALRGLMSFGPFTTSNIAAAYAIRYQQDPLWDALSQFLITPEIDGVLKKDALERLARSAQVIPPHVQSRFAAGAAKLLASKREQHFFTPTEQLPVFAEAVRLLLSIGSLSAVDGVDAVLKLISGTTKGRVEAARTIPYLSGSADATWGDSLLLVLSHDSNPVIRGEAAAGLVMLASASSAIADAVHDRIRELLESDGLRVPVMILRAVQQLARVDPERARSYQAVVGKLASTKSPRLVQEVAHSTAAVLHLRGQDQGHINL